MLAITISFVVNDKGIDFDFIVGQTQLSNDPPSLRNDLNALKLFVSYKINAFSSLYPKEYFFVTLRQRYE